MTIFVAHNGLLAGGSGNHDGVGVNLGNAEVAAEVDEVEGAKFAGDLDDAHIARGAGEHCDAGDVGASEVKPKVGDRRMGLGRVGRSLVAVDEMLPTSSVVTGDDGCHGLWSVESRLGISIVVDRYAGESGRRVIGVHTS